MKTMLKVLAALVALMLCCAPVLAEDNSVQYIQDKGTLVLGLDDSLPPMGFRDEDTNEIVGFDIDVAKEVCKRLGVELICQPISWAAKEMELDAKNIDCIWNGLSITEERLASMAMTIPYMNNKIVMVTKGDRGFETVDDLKGMTVAVQGGSYAEEVLETYPEYAELFKTLDIVTYEEYLTALMDLQQDGVDGVLIDLVVAEFRIAGLGDENLVVMDELEDDLYGVGFRKADEALRDTVNQILIDMKADGSLGEISMKWFGKDIAIAGVDAE